MNAIDVSAADVQLAQINAERRDGICYSPGRIFHHAPCGRWLFELISTPNIADVTCSGCRSALAGPMSRQTDLYRYFDAAGQLLYVGISFSAIQRAASHRTSAPWWTDAVRMEIERHPSRWAAEVAKLAAIASERPLHNIVGRVA